MQSEIILELYWNVTAVGRVLRHQDSLFLKAYGVGPAQFKIMHYIHRQDNRGINLKDIAGLMDVSASNASRLIDKLVHKGWVDRQPSPHSKREVVIRLSREGRRMLRKISPEQQQVLGQCVERGLSAEELQQLNGLLEKFLQQAEPQQSEDAGEDLS